MQTTGAGLDINSIITQLLANPSALIQMVLQQFGGGGAAADGQGANSGSADIGSMIAELLGAGSGHIVEADDYGERLVPDAIEPQRSNALINQIIDQNSLLAAALGACDCWGLDEACRICGGYGASGWTRPDRALFTELVYPAVRAVGAQRGGARGRRPQPYDTQRREQWR